MHDRLLKGIIIFLVIGFITKSAYYAGFFKSKTYKQSGLSMMIPKGWDRDKEYTKQFNFEDARAVSFVTPEKNALTDKPEARLLIVSRKLPTALWIEDEFPEIIRSIEELGHNVKDKGEIKIGTEISKWVVYHNQKANELTLEFYIITEQNYFHQIQYSAQTDKFNVHRLDFEDCKASMEFSIVLF